MALLIDTVCLQSLKKNQDNGLLYPLWSVFLKVYSDQLYESPFEDQQAYDKQN